MDKTTRPPKDNLVRAVFPGPEFRDEADDGHLGTITGYGAVWNQWTEINSSWEGNFLERIAPSAFDKAVSERAPKLLFQHGQDPVIGDKPLGPVRITPDDYGLAYEGDLLDTSYNRDLHPGLKAGLYGSSFRFSVVKEDFNRSAKKSAYNPKGLPERTILEATLPELGPVTFPAYIGATAGARSMTDDFILTEALDQFIEQPEKLRALLERRGIEQPARADALPDDGAASEHSDEGSRSEPEPHEAPPDPPPAVAEPATPDPAPLAGSLSVREDKTVNIEERVARLDEIKARMEELDAQTGVDVMPDAVQAEWDALKEERATHEKAITAYESRKADLERAVSDPARTVRVDGPQLPQRAIVRQNIYDIERIRAESRTDEEYRNNLRDNALRSVETSVFAHPDADESKNKARLDALLRQSEDGQFAAHILATGNPVYKRAFSKMLAGQFLTNEEQRAVATVGSSQLADGGYAIPYALDPTIILTTNGQVNPLRQIARVETLTGAGNTWKGVTSAGISVSRVAEETAVTPTSPSLAQPSVTVQAVKAEIQYSLESDGDWPRLQAEMARLLQDAKDAEEATQFVNGNGNGTTGNPEGVVAGLAATSDVGTTGDGFTLDDIERLTGRLGDRFEPNARFLGHRAVFNKIESLDRATGGGSVYRPLADGAQPTLLGYPRHFSSAMEDDFTTSGNEILLFGDFQQGFIIVDKVGMALEVDPHVRDGNGAWTGQRAILAHWRNNSMVLVDNAFRLLKVGVVTS